MSGLQSRARHIAASGLVLAGLLGLVLAGGASGAPGDATANRVADIEPGGTGSDPQNLFNANGTLLFAANMTGDGVELWKSSGGPLGPGGTEIVEEISPGSGPAGSSSPNSFADVGGTAFFAASDGTSPVLGFHGEELWKSSPPYDAASTELVADINATANGQGSDPEELTNVNGTLLFAADDGSDGVELWKGTGTGATQVEDINTAMGVDSFPQELVNVNGTLFFIADDGNGYEVWKSVAPFTSATMVKDIDPGGTAVPRELTAAGNTLLFVADDGNGEELWKSVPPYDSTPASTLMVEDINTTSGLGSDPEELINVNGTLFFSADDGDGFELWKSSPPYDSTPASTSMVADIHPTVGSAPDGLANVNGTVFFRATDGINGNELWKSNGGPLGTGTVMVANINPIASSSPAEITEVGGQAFFRATDGTNGLELWKSTGAGATMVANINVTPASAASSPQGLTNVAGVLFFQADDGLSGKELWKATIEGPAPPVTIPAPIVPAATVPVVKKKCKKGRKLKKGKCVKKKKKKKR